MIGNDGEASDITYDHRDRVRGIHGAKINIDTYFANDSDIRPSMMRRDGKLYDVVFDNAQAVRFVLRTSDKVWVQNDEPTTVGEDAAAQAAVGAHAQGGSVEAILQDIRAFADRVAAYMWWAGFAGSASYAILAGVESDAAFAAGLAFWGFGGMAAVVVGLGAYGWGVMMYDAFGDAFWMWMPY